MNQVFLDYNYNYFWHHKDDLSFKGFFFDRDSRHFHEEGALDALSALKTTQAIRKKLEAIDGPFSIVKQTSEGILLCTGNMSIFPVFYTWNIDKWLVSDSTDRLLSLKAEKRFNVGAYDEFMAAGFVLGRETLLKDIFKTRASEIILLKPDGTFVSEIYNFWLPENFSQESFVELKVRLVYQLKNVINRLIISLKNRPVVVPLSGGYDSRLIVCLLKLADYKNITCLTYGRPSIESDLSRRVADKLGFQWIFVDYRQIDPKNYLNDPVFQNYVQYAGNNYSMPYLQEYFAVKYLKDNKLVPCNSVFLPGHGGDFLAGGHVNKAAKTRSSITTLPKHLIKKYFQFIPLSEKAEAQIEKRLDEWFSEYTPPDCATDPDFSVFAEDWDIKEKRSKFIFQSVQVFPYFGFAFRLPLWHKDLRNFFRQVPFDVRSNQWLYMQLLEDEFFKPLGVYFGQDEIKERNKPNLLHSVKKWFKPLAPPMVLAAKLKEADWICYDKFTHEMEQQLTNEGQPPLKLFYSYNARICNWYTYQVKKKTRYSE